jgi:hypothetical protein
MENGCFAEGNAVIYESAVEKLDLSTTIVAPRSHCKIRGIGIRCTWTIGRCEDTFYNYFLWIRICTDNLTPRAQILAKTRGACRLYGLQEGKDWRLLIEKSLLGGRIHTQKAVLPSNMWFTSVTFLQKRRNVNMLDKCRIKKMNLAISDSKTDLNSQELKSILNALAPRNMIAVDCTLRTSQREMSPLLWCRGSIAFSHVLTHSLTNTKTYNELLFSIQKRTGECNVFLFRNSQACYQKTEKSHSPNMLFIIVTLLVFQVVTSPNEMGTLSGCVYWH